MGGASYYQTKIPSKQFVIQTKILVLIHKNFVKT